MNDERGWAPVTPVPVADANRRIDGLALEQTIAIVSSMATVLDARTDV